MARVNIVYLQWRRLFLDGILPFINRMRPDNRADLVLSVYCNDGYRERVRAVLERACDVEWRLFSYPDGVNYREKLDHATSSSEPYAIKLDEDCFVNEHTLDFLLDNREALDDPKNLMITPVLSNGVPSVEAFLEDFCTPEERAEVEDFYLHTEFTEDGNGICLDYDAAAVGETYTRLNRHTVGASRWQPDAFYDEVDRIASTTYLGVHPIRINLYAQLRLLDLVERKLDRFLDARPTHLERLRRPYFCNSMFLIKTQMWRELAFAPEFSHYVYDELPLNIERRARGLDILMARGSFGIHTLYNNVHMAPLRSSPFVNSGGGHAEWDFYLSFLRQLDGSGRLSRLPDGP